MTQFENAIRVLQRELREAQEEVSINTANVRIIDTGKDLQSTIPLPLLRDRFAAKAAKAMAMEGEFNAAINVLTSVRDEVSDAEVESTLKFMEEAYGGDYRNTEKFRKENEGP